MRFLMLKEYFCRFHKPLRITPAIAADHRPRLGSARITGMIQIQRDGNGSPYIEWEQAGGQRKRAWVQPKHNPEKDWAGTGRYLNVVRCESPGHPGGNPTDFPIFSTLTDEQVLEGFVATVCGITGCRLP